MKAKSRIDITQLVFITDLFKAVMDNLQRRKTVTHFVLPRTDPDQDGIEFELRITRIGDTRIPARPPAVKTITTKRDRR